MPAPHASLTPARAATLIAERSFTPASPGAGRVGVEVEWLTYKAPDGGRPDLATLEAVGAAAGPLPRGSTLTFEPGGQLEVSTAALGGVDAACDAVDAAGAALAPHLAAAGIALGSVGLDPSRLPRRVTTAPRYAAMEAYFDSLGRAGREMMCGTAAVQVNVDLGDGPEAHRRWRAAHAVGPVLAAAFANSPVARGRPTGYLSTRMAVWAAIDPCRTRPVAESADPVAAWADYAMAAPVMLVREGEDRYRPVLRPLPFAAWVAGDGGELSPPDDGDLAYHLTTLFPPVRPRGWLELRMVDAVPDPWWRVAVAVAAALVCEPSAGAAAASACSGAGGWWDDAARHGLHHGGLAAAALRCFDAAIDALAAVGAGGETRTLCEEYRERYVRRARTPADDVLDDWAARGAPPAEQEEQFSWT